MMQALRGPACHHAAAYIPRPCAPRGGCTAYRTGGPRGPRGGPRRCWARVLPTLMMCCSGEATSSATATDDDCGSGSICSSSNWSPISRQIILRGLLDPQEIACLLEAARAWPSLCELAEQGGGPCAGDLCAELQGAAHDLAMKAGGHLAMKPGVNSEPAHHVVLYLHRECFLQGRCPALWSKLLRAVSTPPREWEPGGVPLPWAVRARELNVRCIELHTYACGGGLIDANHRDDGSTLTMSVLLSDPREMDGGRFITYDGPREPHEPPQPLQHELQRGDAILFQSEDRHNVSTVTRGVRQSLVVELWTGKTNIKNRFS
jgi:hypothetical protein